MVVGKSLFTGDADIVNFVTVRAPPSASGHWTTESCFAGCESLPIR